LPLVAVSVLFIITIVALFLIYQFSQTFSQLYFAEGERDRWQRPNDVIQCLNLKNGSVVADLGCGVGYFSLKLAPKVGGYGSVLAEDILDESLTFLRIRALFHHQNNIRIIHGNPDDPLLPAGGVDSVLSANTYHEFTKPLSMLDRLYVWLLLRLGAAEGPRNAPEFPLPANSYQEAETPVGLLSQRFLAKNPRSARVFIVRRPRFFAESRGRTFLIKLL
jgi:SAM-dependent methyltransferase